MLLTSMIIPIIATICYVTMNEASMVMTVMGISIMLLITLGTVIYLGYYEVMTGFSTMTEDERKQYDLDKIASFMGLTLVILAFLTFFVTLACIVYLSNIDSIIAMVTILLTVLIGASIYVSINKNSKMKFFGNLCGNGCVNPL